MSGLVAGPLNVRIGRRPILHDVTLGPLARGTVTALLGPNGSGKSTLLRALAGLLPAHGPITLNGQALSSLSRPAHARLCAYMPQALPPPIRMQVMESVLVSLRVQGGSLHDEAFSQAMETLSRLGIANMALRFMDELSGGQRQLVGLAQALVRSPDLLLLDEPLSALDLRHQFTVMDLLRRETKRRRMVSVIVLHDLSMALRHTDAATMLAKGRVLASGPVREVVTPAILAQAYGVQARVEDDASGMPMVCVDGVV